MQTLKVEKKSNLVNIVGDLMQIKLTPIETGHLISKKYVILFLIISKKGDEEDKMYDSYGGTEPLSTTETRVLDE
jgi:hypothetical protein